MKSLKALAYCVISTTICCGLYTYAQSLKNISDITSELSRALSDTIPSDSTALIQGTYTFSPEGDTIIYSVRPEDRKGPLTEQDYIEVARELGVEVAAIKAIVDIEAGRQHQGFWSEGKPIINFDLTVYRQMARRNGINLSKYTKTHPTIFARPNISKYGSQQAAQQARLDQAMSIHPLSAIQGTFWGMFQLGGFNWKKAGASSPQEFVALMSRSERDQLELFSEFIRQTGLLQHLRNKNWSAFARAYNGPAYAKRGYHTRLAAAYARHKKTG